MIQKLRLNTFETNSSSVHSLTFNKTNIYINRSIMDDFSECNISKTELNNWFSQFIEENYTYILSRIRDKKSVVIDIDWESD